VATVDQAVSSLANLGLTVFAARSLGIEAFGAFGLAFATYIVALGVTRAVVTEPLLSRPELATGEAAVGSLAAVGGAAFGTGAVASLVVAGVGYAVGGLSGRVLVALAVVLSGLVLQDAWRYTFIAQNRPASALANDVIWVVAQVAMVATLAVLGRVSAATLVLTWGAAGAVAAVAGCVQAHTAPRMTAGWRWVVEHRDLGGRYLAEFLSATGVGYGAIFGLGAIAGLPAIAALRASQAFFGPVNVVFAAIVLTVIPEAARRRGRGGRLRHLMVAASGMLVLLALVWLAVGIALPSAVGRALFGASWEAASELVLPVGLGVVGGGLAAGGIAGLRALGAARESLRARLVGLPFAAGLPLVGATINGATGFAMGLCGAAAVGAGVYWWQFNTVLRSAGDHRSGCEELPVDGLGQR